MDDVFDNSDPHSIHDSITDHTTIGEVPHVEHADIQIHPPSDDDPFRHDPVDIFVHQPPDSEITNPPPTEGLNLDGPLDDGHDHSGFGETIDLLSPVDPTSEPHLGIAGSGTLPPDMPHVGTIIGNPEIDEEHWHMQVHPDTCAVVSQEYVIESFTHEDIDEDHLVDIAIDKGYYFPGQGTQFCDVGKLIEDYGIPVERAANNSFGDLVDKLQHGQKIIVAVDANEIWSNSDWEQLCDQYFMPEANHALEVIGYDDNTGHVILNDPGTPDGRGYEVSKQDFLDAWDDSNHFMVWTKEPAPILNDASNQVVASRLGEKNGKQES